MRFAETPLGSKRPVRGLRIRLEDGGLRQFRTLLRKSRRGSLDGWLKGMKITPGNHLRFTAKRIKGLERRAQRYGQKLVMLDQAAV